MSVFDRVVGGSKKLFTLLLLFLWQSPFTSAESTPNQNNKRGKLPVPASEKSRLSCVTTLVKCSEGTANIVGKNCKTFDYKVKRNYYKHQHTTSFHRVTRKRWHLIPNGIVAVLF